MSAPEPVLESITLFEEERDGTSTTVRATRYRSGAVSIDGQNLGAAPTEFFGGGEYEYSMTVEPPYGARVWRFLSSSDFAGANPFPGIRTWLETQPIPYDFWSRAGD